MGKSNVLIQNDCSLVFEEGELKIAQTTLGFLFRKLVMDFSEDAALEYFRRGVSKSQRQALQLALGEDYAAKYEAFFLPFVDAAQIENVRYLSEGANGTVWSADWVMPHSRSSGETDIVRVALKQPKRQIEDARENAIFLNEVFRDRNV